MAYVPIRLVICGKNGLSKLKIFVGSKYTYCCATKVDLQLMGFDLVIEYKKGTEI